LSPEGLPVGLEIDGLPGDDRKVLAIGVMIEGVLGRIAPPAG
jgi:mandelamide amidase